MLDSTVVALALPTIEKDLDASRDNVQRILNGYLLVISVLVVTAGRLGDIAGRRRVFLAGMAIFAAGSVLAAVAWDDAILVAARVIQGTGGRGDAVALARDRQPRLPRRAAGPGARHLGRGLGPRARDRPRRRRRADRSRLAADLLDQPADLRRRHRDHAGLRPRVPRRRRQSL
jgi:MFS family permease